MNAKELESRTAEAEKDPAKVRQLIIDFKAHKDEQLSDLTGQVNALQTDISAQAKELAECRAKLVEATKTETEKAIEESKARLASAQADLDNLLKQ